MLLSLSLVSIWISFVPFDDRFGFLLPVLVSPGPMSVFAFCCSSLLFAAFCCPLSLFLVFDCSSCQPLSIGPELKQMNQNRNEKCFLLLVALFGF